MKRYQRLFKETDIDEISKKEYEALIEKLKNNTFRNKEMRIEFAKIVMSLSSSDFPLAKKLVWKMGEFAKYWQNDEMIDEDEWRKLNNSNNIIE
jgi:hypothetical protein